MLQNYKKMKQRRTFSEALKKEEVELIESGKIKISELFALYSVSKSSV